MESKPTEMVAANNLAARESGPEILLRDIAELSRLSISLRLTPLELHNLRVAAHLHGVDPALYVRNAVRDALVADCGPEVVKRWT